MESEWNKMSDADRAEFAAWREHKRTEASAPKRYNDMTPDEKRAWHRTIGIPVQRGDRL